MARERMIGLRPCLVAMGVVVLFISLMLTRLVQDKVEASRASISDQPQPSFEDQILKLEEEGLTLQLSNDQLDQNERLELRKRLSQVELDLRLLRGTASSLEQAEAKRRQKVWTNSCGGANGADGTNNNMNH